MSAPLFEKVAFIGLGLIGSSLARVMIAEGLTQNIVASTRSEKTLQDAKALGLIQQGYSDPVQAVQGADLVVLALPVTNSTPSGRSNSTRTGRVALRFFPCTLVKVGR